MSIEMMLRVYLEGASKLANIDTYIYQDIVNLESYIYGIYELCIFFFKFSITQTLTCMYICCVGVLQFLEFSISSCLCQCLCFIGYDMLNQASSSWFEVVSFKTFRD